MIFHVHSDSLGTAGALSSFGKQEVGSVILKACGMRSSLQPPLTQPPNETVQLTGAAVDIQPIFSRDFGFLPPEGLVFAFSPSRRGTWHGLLSRGFGLGSPFRSSGQDCLCTALAAALTMPQVLRPYHDG